jgi:hypothetical protein
MELKRLKAEVGETVKEIVGISGEVAERDKETAERLKEAELPFLENIAKLRQQREEQGKRIGAEIAERKSRNAEAVRTMKDQLNEQRRKLGASDMALNVGFRDVTAQQTREIDGLKVTYAAEESAASERLKRLRSAKKSMQKQHSNESGSLSAQFTELQKSHESAEAALANENSRELAQTTKKLNKKGNRLRAVLSEKSGEFSRNDAATKDELRKLAQTRSDMCETNLHLLDAFERERDQEIGRLRKLFENHTNDTRNSLEQELSADQSRFAERIRTFASDFAQKSSARRQERSVERITTLKEIEIAGFSKDEHRILSAAFQRNFDAFSKELQGIEPPALDDNAKYRELQVDLEKLRHWKGQRIDSMRSERNSIEARWEREIEAEYDRHSRSGVPSASGRNRDQVKQAMQRQIEDVRNTAQVEMNRLHGFMDIEMSRHDVAMKRIFSIREDVVNGSNVSRLREQLSMRAAEFEFEIDTAHARMIKSLKTAELSNEALMRKFANDAELSRNRFEDLISAFLRTTECLQMQIVQIGQGSDREMCHLSDEQNQMLTGMRELHSQKCTELSDLISHIGTELMEGSIRNQETLKAEADQQIAWLNEYDKNGVDDMAKRQADWQHLLSYLIERIEALTTARDVMRSKFETRDGRQSDLDMIQNLSDYLKTIQSELVSKVKDLSQFRVLMVEQEKIYNSHFGKNPSVGVIRFTSASESADSVRARRSNTQA